MGFYEKFISSRPVCFRMQGFVSDGRFPPLEGCLIKTRAYVAPIISIVPERPNNTCIPTTLKPDRFKPVPSNAFSRVEPPACSYSRRLPNRWWILSHVWTCRRMNRPKQPQQFCRLSSCREYIYNALHCLYCMAFSLTSRTVMPSPRDCRHSV